MDLKQRKFAIGYLAIALLAILVFQFPLFGPRAATLSYSEFKALVVSRDDLVALLKSATA